MDNEEKKLQPDAQFWAPPLLAFDRLEVGPVRVEPRRMSAPYRLIMEDREDATEFIYSFDEAVFDPEEPESMNLASMMAAQVALNYGLFCREIVFHGVYDASDRRLLRAMAENTAREIYVKKILEPNPFLIGEAKELRAVQRAKYLQAGILFSNNQSGKTHSGWKLWPTRKNRYCILSSGGKDSLLSYGLMKEITGRDAGGQVHPIFVNESGRHWFTALNAHRHLKANDPNTARVWVNSDRVFAWMLRRMPFIRKDFADVRSDEYPIRLWTVAVFLFGVLPVMRKRGIGRLLVGDEYDTTVRRTHAGIRHYDGLFDQSIHFDNALSRYFFQKGWSVAQFSILRPLSELLIEKILVERYPNLQRLQTSCHATHKDGESVRPCGRCEKCRRIVGMLTALGADPSNCGYTAKQISQCLEKIAAGHVHQEDEGVALMFFLLREKGKLPGNHPKARKHSEILKLRFDTDCSPTTAVPADLRQSLFSILLMHADGAVIRRSKKWLPINVETDPAMTRPYPFEAASTLASDNDDNGASRRDDALWGELTWPDAEKRLQNVDIALLPVGAVEQHGPHLPLDTDAVDAEYLARRVAETCSDPKPLVLPTIAYGVSYHHADFKGTLTISNETLSRLVYDIGMSSAANGIRKLVIINGHGGNEPALHYAAQRINRDARIFVCVDSGESSDFDIDGMIETPNDVHAGEIETSTSLALRPHLVKMTAARKAVPDFSNRYLNFSSKRGIGWYAYTRKISATGVMGDPTRASAEKGKRIWEIMIAHLVGFVEELKQMTLEEIHNKKY